MHPSRLRRSIATTAVALVAALGASVPALAQDAPTDANTPMATPPDDTGVVHSWALAPGDGTVASGERENLSYELPPGGSTDDVVTLFNYGNVTLTFQVYATDAFNNDDGSFNLLPAGETPQDVGTWVHLPLERFELTVPPLQQATFPISITVPPDARPGDHVGALLASSEALGTSPDGDTVRLDRRTGSRIYVRVDGDLRPELAVEDLTTTYEPDLNPFGGSAEVRYRIVNRGNVRLSGTHRLSVGGPFGLGRRSLEEEAIPELLPGESIEVSRTVEDLPATGLSFTEVDLRPVSVDGEGLDAGTSRASGLAIPFTVVALVLAAVLAWFAHRAYRRHRDDEAAVIAALDDDVTPQRA